ncbi:DUF4760 domain-containing protein [Rhodoferax sp.]|uniref:DUF4760 domain-containing protein n=1 Tax=Rhodoferax sp. TaxID=50421 RepID=UPI002633BED7|nr:DUF4760 domain-containing protein [Rhodoferax sp.]MDD2810257.1 DUF4760 domain-containing protein [Rhodoferax sp.]
MTPYEILTLLIGTTTAGILLVQAGLALKSLKADHERRKKQATFEFVQKIRPAWLEAKHAIEEKWGDEPLTSKELLEIDSDFQLLKLVRNLLGQLEHLSVGMNSGVFDKDLLYRMSGSQLISIYHRLHTYIDRAQKSSPKAYIEYQDLVKSFEDRRRTRPDASGNIVNS